MVTGTTSTSNEHAHMYLFCIQYSKFVTISAIVRTTSQPDGQASSCYAAALTIDS